MKYCSLFVSQAPPLAAAPLPVVQPQKPMAAMPMTQPMQQPVTQPQQPMAMQTQRHSAGCVFDGVWLCVCLVCPFQAV